MKPKQKTYLRASEAADYLGISYQTLYTYARQGKIQYTTTPAGQRIYTRQQLNQTRKTQNTDQTTHDKPQYLAFYLRDSQGNQDRINRQKQKLIQAYGTPDKTYQDKASGLNENRKGLTRLLNDARAGKINTIAITAKDRLTRFGYSYLERLIDEYGCDIIILDDAKQEKTAYDELIQDFMSLIASFSGKYYKLRGIKHEKMLLELADKRIDDEHAKRENHE